MENREIKLRIIRKNLIYRIVKSGEKTQEQAEEEFKNLISSTDPDDVAVLELLGACMEEYLLERQSVNTKEP
jgi:hypothetical protein